jgi:hypothetical protein
MVGATSFVSGNGGVGGVSVGATLVDGATPVNPEERGFVLSIEGTCLLRC